MGERNTGAGEPPSSRSKVMGARAIATRAARTGSTAKSGRPSYDDYAKRVCQVLRWTPFQLEACAALAQLPGVQQRIRQKPTVMLPLGTALRSLLDEAVGDVERVAKAGEDLASQRLATFLQLWYRERRTVVQVAATLGLTRTHVAHQIQRPALDLVVRRFLELAWRAQLSA